MHSVGQHPNLRHYLLAGAVFEPTSGHSKMVSSQLPLSNGKCAKTSASDQRQYCERYHGNG